MLYYLCFERLPGNQRTLQEVPGLAEKWSKSFPCWTVNSCNTLVFVQSKLDVTCWCLRFRTSAQKYISFKFDEEKFVLGTLEVCRQHLCGSSSAFLRLQKCTFCLREVVCCCWHPARKNLNCVFVLTISVYMCAQTWTARTHTRGSLYQAEVRRLPHRS